MASSNWAMFKSTCWCVQLMPAPGLSEFISVRLSRGAMLNASLETFSDPPYARPRQMIPVGLVEVGPSTLRVALALAAERGARVVDPHVGDVAREFPQQWCV